MENLQEQIVSSCALVLEAGKAEGDFLMDELNAVPDKLVDEDKYVIDYPTDEVKTKPDKLYNSTTKAVKTSKRSKKPPNTKEKLFFMVKERCSADSSPLLIFHQNICGLRGNKTQTN
jgi:hypothetical protein